MKRKYLWFSVAKVTLQLQMSFCLSFCSFVIKIPQQLEIIILHHSFLIILHASFIIIHSSFTIHSSLFIHPSFILRLLTFSACSQSFSYFKELETWNTVCLFHCKCQVCQGKVQKFQQQQEEVNRTDQKVSM